MEQLVPLIFILVGAAFVVHVRVQAARARRSQSWHPTRGTVTHSDVVSERGHKSTIYKAAVSYTYEVGGREYRSDTICAGGTLDTSQRRRAAERCARYPVGASVPVFYDPTDPSRACLEQKAEGTLLFGAIGAVVAALGLLNFLGIVRFD